MSETKPDRERLLEEAIDLIIRLQNDPGNPVAIELARAWRARGSTHEEIWARLSKVHGASGRILTEQRRIDRRNSLGLARRNFMLGGVAVLGGAAAALSFGPGLLLRARADHMTEKGEVRRIELPDGSVATLGPESAISLDFEDDRRTVNLLAGMSFFEVASDPSRPFSVRAGALAATALGTAFDVSDDAGIVTVTVDHGLVDVRATGSVLEAGLSLAEGQWLAFEQSSGSVDRGQREVEQVATWRDNLIVAERETVSALIARIGRWIPGSIVIADPFIGKQRVSGIFDLTNPFRALEAVVHPTGAHIRRISSLMTVISPL